MFTKSFDDITLADLEVLVATKQRENLHLEYKRLQNTNDEGKKELLKDVSGMSNAAGGYIIIGVGETKAGEPDTIDGVPPLIGSQKIDEWIDNVLTANLDLRLRYELKILQVAEGKVVVCLRVPESTIKPHMVTFNEKNCYYLRHNTKVEPATHNEVRDMFEQSRRLYASLEDFLNQRKLLDDRSPDFGLNDHAENLVSRMPDSLRLPKSFALFTFVPKILNPEMVDVVSDDMQQWLIQNLVAIPPLGQGCLFNVYDRRVHLNGAVFPKASRNSSDQFTNRFFNYFELLNSGFVESGLSYDLFKNYSDKEPPEAHPVMFFRQTVSFVWTLMNFVIQYMHKIGYRDVMLFQLSLVNVKGYALADFGPDREHEPFNDFNDTMNPPLCLHDRFKLIEQITVSAASATNVQQTVQSVALKLSRAFGHGRIVGADLQGNLRLGGVRIASLNLN